MKVMGVGVGGGGGLVRSHGARIDNPMVVYQPALLPCPVLWSLTTCFCISRFYQHADLTLSYLVTISAVLVSCSYFTASTFCCSPLCCVLKTVLLLVVSLLKIHFFLWETPNVTKWSSLLHGCVLPYLALRSHCLQCGKTKLRCKPPLYCSCFSSSWETSTAC
jgi:hypothetical protein